MKNSEYFITSDLALTTALSLSFPIVKINKTSLNKSFFVFDRSKELEKYIKSYWNEELRISPLSYFSQIKVIKTRIYSK